MTHILGRLPDPWRIFARLAIAILAILLLVAIWGYGEPRIAQAYPEWAWRNGTVTMQRSAAYAVVARIKPGMSQQQVRDLIGGGRAKWPEPGDPHASPKEGIPYQIAFNVRAPSNTGIIVTFLDGQVVEAHCYD